MLSFTTGEMTAVETYISPSAILTQGFQQTFDLGTFITQPINPNFSFGIYPNPATGHFYLITEAEFNAHVTVRIMDLLEREISFTTYIQQDKINIQPFDLSSSTQGVYLVSITVKDNSSKPAYTYIQKIQIIR